MAWSAIGLTISFNVVFNHMLATLIKPGSPTDLRYIEQLRHQYKRREHRKEVEDDRFVQISKIAQKIIFINKVTANKPIATTKANLSTLSFLSLMPFSLISSFCCS